MSNILIADAGSTKTDWSLIDTQSEVILRTRTSGINPVTSDSETICEGLSLLDHRVINSEIQKIYFYGAGCLSDIHKTIVSNCLKHIWKDTEIHVYPDILGACRALFKNGSGIACILGTGSNTCLFEDGAMQSQIPSLGYVLGDEGGGVSLGKRLLNGIYKRQFSEIITKKFHNKYNFTVSDIVERVYRNSNPQSFIASFSRFISENLEYPEIQNLVLEEFDSFFIKNIIPYGIKMPLGFVGSIAWNYEKELRDIATTYGFEITKILKEPIKGLEHYYTRK